MSSRPPVLLVGDNPFLGVSHLSQEQARSRGVEVLQPAHAAELLGTALDNGADGFLFSVGEPSLMILRQERIRRLTEPPLLYAIAPWSFEYVRAAVKLGGLPGLARLVLGRIVRARNVYAVAWGAQGAVRRDLGALFKAYMSYEVGRIRRAAGRRARLRSLLLHEIVTDMALGLEMEWLFRAHVEACRRAGVQLGFNTRNLPLLVETLSRWDISLEDAVIAAPFNASGFQMSPSREAFEATLAHLGRAEVIAFSILAAGRLPYTDAIEYVAHLPNVAGVAVGVSKPQHAVNTFQDLRRAFTDRRGEVAAT